MATTRTPARASRRKGNSTITQKAALRSLVLAQVPDPVVMETHGGYGHIWRAVYSGVERGVVFEKDEQRADVLAVQRPTWSVYATDSERALRAGAGGHLPINVLDLDPWGDPWPTIKAFFESRRAFAGEMWVVVNDGLRAKVRMRAGWSGTTLAPMVQRFGNDLFPVYLEVCRELLREAVAPAGYELQTFHGYYTGTLDGMTHYTSRLVRRA